MVEFPRPVSLRTFLLYTYIYINNVYIFTVVDARTAVFALSRLYDVFVAFFSRRCELIECMCECVYVGVCLWGYVRRV